MEPIISANKLNVSFRGGVFRKKKRILKDIDISIYPKEMIMIIGGSGCGKSTLLKQLFGLERCHERNSVTATVDGKKVTGRPYGFRVQKLLRRKVYYAPQFSLSNENLTVREEIQKNALMFRKEGFYSEKELQELVKNHHLWDDKEKLLNTKVGRISGGQKKKLLLACSEAIDPLVYLFDEPDSGLDEPTAYNFYIRNLRDSVDAGKTVVVVSHHPHNNMVDFSHHPPYDEAAVSRHRAAYKTYKFEEIFTRLIVLAKYKNSSGEIYGTIAFDGTPEQARAFFELDSGEPYSAIVSRIMTEADGGSSKNQENINKYIERYKGQQNAIEPIASREG